MVPPWRKAPAYRRRLVPPCPERASSIIGGAEPDQDLVLRVGQARFLLELLVKAPVQQRCRGQERLPGPHLLRAEPARLVLCAQPPRLGHAPMVGTTPAVRCALHRAPERC